MLLSSNSCVTTRTRERKKVIGAYIAHPARTLLFVRAQAAFPCRFPQAVREHGVAKALHTGYNAFRGGIKR